MPTWAIHLSIAKKLNTKLNLSKDEFLFGNILPDIPNGYYIKDISSIISYNETHFIPVDEDKYINCPKIPKYELFLDKYSNYIKNPVILGYYVHLLTDYYFNKEIINNYITLGVNVDFNTIKQFDFKLLEKYLINKTDIKIPKYNEKIYFDSIKLLKLTKDDIKKTINYLNNKYYKDNIKSNDEYKLIPFNELLKIYEGCIEFINSEIEKLKK